MTTRHPTHRLSSGFTLIELLVVFVIVAVLATLVFSTVGRMRERGNRVQCVSNLRAVHGGVARFAAENDGRVPIGYRLGKKQFNTTLYSGSSGKWVLLGRLLKDGVITDPRVLFCPSEKDRTQAFATAENPWPEVPGKNLQGGYATAPAVDWESAEEPAVWPRLVTLGQTALLADGAGMPARVDSRHKDGVNVLYTDGSARWINRSEFDEELARCKTAGAGANAAQAEMWEIFAGTREPDSARR